MDINNNPSCILSVHHGFETIELLKKAIKELVIRFDNDPKFYLREDFRLLIAVIYNGLIHLYETGIDARIITTWLEVPTDEQVPSAKLVADTIERLRLRVETEMSEKQDKLISGINIKTINGESVLGGGNLEITGTEVDDESISKESTWSSSKVSLELDKKENNLYWTINN